MAATCMDCKVSLSTPKSKYLHTSSTCKQCNQVMCVQTIPSHFDRCHYFCESCHQWYADASTHNHDNFDKPADVVTYTAIASPSSSAAFDSKSSSSSFATGYKRDPLTNQLVRYVYPIKK